MKRRLFAAAALAIALVVPSVFLWSSEQEAKKVDKKKPAAAGDVKAVAVLVPFEKSKVHGVLHFHQKGKVVEITGEVSGLSPGKHGFHVHEFGDISSKDGMSTGGHYNPTNKMHGGPMDAERHVGDLGNITADENGKAVINMKDSVIRLTGPHSIVGRAILVHHDADDLKTQPTGHAGGRIAAGVIGIAK